MFRVNGNIRFGPVLILSGKEGERGRVLKVLAELTERTGFASAVKTVDEAVRLNATDPDSLQSLYRQTYADVPLLPPLENKADLPQQKVIPFRNDLKIYLNFAFARQFVSMLILNFSI